METQCSKCGEVFDGNFCTNCGKQLKKDGKALWQKCPICGEIESAKLVEKGICEKELERLREEIKEYEDGKIKEWYGKFYFLESYICRWIIIMMLWLVSAFIVGIYRTISEFLRARFNPGMDSLMLTLLIVLPSLIFLFLTLFLAFRSDSARKKAREEFLVDYPKYKEML